MADLVHGAEALHEAARGAITAVRTTAHEHELVGDGAQVGALGVDEGGVVMNGLEALDLAVLAQVGEELAALGRIHAERLDVRRFLADVGDHADLRDEDVLHIVVVAMARTFTH